MKSGNGYGSASGVVGPVVYLRRETERSDGDEVDVNMGSGSFVPTNEPDPFDLSAARMDYTVAYAILILEERGSNVTCRVKEITFVSNEMRPDHYDERANVVPQSVSFRSCDEFLANELDNEVRGDHG